MKVTAKCTAAAWESNSCVMFQPGAGPLPGGLYEIERDGPLASLKIGSRFVFDFDRNAGPDDKPHDYSCKKPGCESLRPFKTLNALGTHTREAHTEQRVESDEEVVVAKDLRGQHRKGKTFTCKECGEVLPNLYAMGQHKKTHANVAEAEPVLA